MRGSTVSTSDDRLLETVKETPSVLDRSTHPVVQFHNACMMMYLISNTSRTGFPLGHEVKVRKLRFTVL